MKSKTVKGKHEFDYPLDGMIFLPCERVCLMDRNTGQQMKLTMVQLREKVNAKDMARIESDLQLTNLFTTDGYQIIGLADPEPL
jgi:hypothetical protein